LELGPRDLAAGTALMATRLGNEKTPVSLDSAPARLSFELTAFQDLLLRRATEFRDQRTVTVDTWDEFVAAVATGWARAFHCGQPECEDDIKAATSATPRVIPPDGEPGERFGADRPFGTAGTRAVCTNGTDADLHVGARRMTTPVDFSLAH